MAAAIIVAHNGFTDSEFIYAYYRLKEEGITVEVATLDGGNVTGEKGHVFKSTFATNYISMQSKLPWDIVIIVGGVKNLEKTRQDLNAVRLVQRAVEEKKILGLICHGAQLAIEADICGGRRITGYYSIRKDIENAGAIYENQPVVTDGRIVSSPHYKFNGEFMGEVIRLWRSTI